VKLKEVKGELRIDSHDRGIIIFPPKKVRVFNSLAKFTALSSSSPSIPFSRLSIFNFQYQVELRSKVPSDASFLRIGPCHQLQTSVSWRSSCLVHCFTSGRAGEL
jgi:hypothetical protein